MNGIYGYCEVYALGHKLAEGIFDGEVQIEEKIDGSQFSFGKFDGVLKARSHHQELDVENTTGMFRTALDAVIARRDLLTDGWVYRAEYLSKPKHNAIAYDRVPKDNLMLFDVCDGLESYLSYWRKCEEALRLGLEVVPELILPIGPVTVGDMKKLLETMSILGGSKIEGVVIKNYSKFGRDKKVLMCKYVSEEFKETNRKNWKLENPGHNDIIARVGDSLNTEARWCKAIIHLKERGELTGSPKDIGPLMKEVHQDILKEEAEVIKQQLFDWAWKKVGHKATRGLPEWYKEELAKTVCTEEGLYDGAADV